MTTGVLEKLWLCGINLILEASGHEQYTKCSAECILVPNPHTGLVYPPPRHKACRLQTFHNCSFLGEDPLKKQHSPQTHMADVFLSHWGQRLSLTKNKRLVPRQEGQSSSAVQFVSKTFLWDYLEDTLQVRPWYCVAFAPWLIYFPQNFLLDAYPPPI